MEPNIWGPAGWTFLHSITFQYPEEPTDIDKRKYFTFFHSLKNVLPCPTCREHYETSFEINQIRLNNRQELIEWLIDIHNDVNRTSGKKVYSYDEVYQLYNDMYGVTGESNYGYLFIILIIFIIICCYHKEIILNYLKLS
jgi:hypothetical protein